MRLTTSILTLAFAGATLLTASPVYDTSAMAELTGSRSSTAGDITITGDRYKTFDISWEITAVSGGYNYSYTFDFTRFTGRGTQGAPNISHFILDLSDNCTAASGCVTDSNFGLEYNTYSAGGAGNSNPNFPAGASITGVKFTETNLPTAGTISFLSNRLPVYGDFYLKGGSDNGVFNAGLSNHNSSAISDFIARPDTATATPEPSTWAMLASGLALVTTRFRRRKA